MLAKSLLLLALGATTALGAALPEHHESKGSSTEAAAPLPSNGTAAADSAEVPAHRASTGRVCGTRISIEKKKNMKEHFAKHRVKGNKNKSKTVPVHFHVIMKSKSASGGNVPDKQLTDQIAALNKAYVNASLTFRLVNTTRTTNADWFSKASTFDDGMTYQTAMKKALRVGDAGTLNLYSVGFEQGQAAQGLLGYSTFPWDYQGAPQDDGVVFRYTTMPGGSLSRFNLGGTIQHEVGHWVGLYHTFNEGDFANTCNGSSDEVDDTPMEKTSASGCETGRDTCPKSPGLDPIHNYMDYSDDACYNQFTPGQTTRMLDQLATYRSVQ